MDVVIPLIGIGPPVSLFSTVLTRPPSKLFTAASFDPLGLFDTKAAVSKNSSVP